MFAQHVLVFRIRCNNYKNYATSGTLPVFFSINEELSSKTFIYFLCCSEIINPISFHLVYSEFVELDLHT